MKTHNETHQAKKNQVEIDIITKYIQETSINDLLSFYVDAKSEASDEEICNHFWDDRANDIALKALCALYELEQELFKIKVTQLEKTFFKSKKTFFEDKEIVNPFAPPTP